jgi:hypothetical protein
MVRRHRPEPRQIVRPQRSLSNNPCIPIHTLPNEVLLDIVHYLKVDVKYRWHLTHDSARDLASVARTCRRFYELAMPALYERVSVWPKKSWPKDICYYPPNVGRKRGLSYVRTLDLAAYAGPLEDADITTVHNHEDYLRHCFRMLKDTKSIQSLSLYFGLYDSSNSDPADAITVDFINRHALMILDRISKMRLPELQLNLARKTARIDEILSIIGRKVDCLCINSLCLEVASRLRHCRRLKSIQADANHERNPLVEVLFWSALSQLPNLRIVRVDAIPFPPRPELQFPQIVDITFLLSSETDAAEWARSFVTVLTRMPGLENLIILGGPATRGYSLESDGMPISIIACVKLKELTLYDCPIPKGLMSTIAKHCMSLTECDIHERDNIDDEDIRQLSLSCPNLRELHLKFAERVTTGLEYLTVLQQLERLEVNYTAGKYMGKSVFLKFANSCPKLEKIVFSRSPLQPSPFETAPLEDLFPAAAELPLYFEPRISKLYPLYGYEVRIDKLREDMFQFKQLTKRLGHPLVKSSCSACADLLQASSLLREDFEKMHGHAK